MWLYLVAYDRSEIVMYKQVVGIAPDIIGGLI